MAWSWGPLTYTQMSDLIKYVFCLPPPPPDMLSHRQTQKPVLPQAVRGNTIRIIAHELPCSAPREAASSLRMPVQAQSRGVRGVVGTLTPILPEEETLPLIQACSWTGCPGPGHLPAPALLGM